LACKGDAGFGKDREKDHVDGKTGGSVGGNKQGEGSILLSEAANL